MTFDDTQVREFLRSTHDTKLLSEREKHLVGLAVTLTRGCQVCTRNRIEKARAAGIGDDVLNGARQRCVGGQCRSCLGDCPGKL